MMPDTFFNTSHINKGVKYWLKIALRVSMKAVVLECGMYCT